MSYPKQLAEQTIKTIGKKAEEVDEKDEDDKNEDEKNENEKNEKYDENDKLEDGLHEDKLHETSLHEKVQHRDELHGKPTQFGDKLERGDLLNGDVIQQGLGDKTFGGYELQGDKLDEVDDKPQNELHSDKLQNDNPQDELSSSDKLHSNKLHSNKQQNELQYSDQLQYGDKLQQRNKPQNESHSDKLQNEFQNQSHSDKLQNEFQNQSHSIKQPPSMQFVFPDMVAFDRVRRRCQHWPDGAAVQRIELQGFESYLVEQWVYERSARNSIVIYTGNPADRVCAYRVEVVCDEAAWPGPLRAYIGDLGGSRHTFPTLSDYGTVFVTNVSQLDASLTLVPIPGGDIKKIYKCYVQNHDLKHLGCGTRAATAIGSPGKPAEDKFRAAYHVPAGVPVRYAVRELVCVVQTFLYYYGVLPAAWCDGLCCRGTEAGLTRWWRLVADIRPCCGLLSRRPPGCTAPVRFLSVIGLTLFIRTLLALGDSSFMAPKDPLDVQGFRVSVLLFQRAQKLHRTRENEGYLDRETITRLFAWVQTVKTGQNFAKDLSKVKTLVKNTVLDLTSVRALQVLTGVPANAADSPGSPPGPDQAPPVADCQDYRQIRLLCAGPRLLYLFFAKGRPANLDRDCLAARYHRASLAVASLASASHRAASPGHSRHHDTSRATILKYAWNSDEMGYPGESQVSGNLSYGNQVNGNQANQPYPDQVNGGLSYSNQPNQPDQTYSNQPYPNQSNQLNAPSHPNFSCTAARFNARLRRRTSVPFIAREAGVFATELQAADSTAADSPAPGGPPGTHAVPWCGGYRAPPPATRKRSLSFAAVDQALETAGTDCFDVSGPGSPGSLVTEEWLAAQYIALLHFFRLGIVRLSADLRGQTDGYRANVYRGIRLDTVLARYQNSRADCSKVTAKYRELRQKLRTSYKISARLKYEVHLLLQKTKEVEANLKSLDDFKIANLQSRIAKCRKCLHVQQSAAQCPRNEPPEAVLSWRALLRRPYLLLYVVFCYIWCLWTVYFGTDPRYHAQSQSDVFKTLFCRVYYGSDAKPVKRE